MTRRMIGALVGALVLTFVALVALLAQRPPNTATEIQRPRCVGLPNQPGLEAVTGKVVYLYTPKVLSADRMSVQFNLKGDAPSACNCLGYVYQGNTEEVKAVYAALLTAVNNCKLNVTFCCQKSAQPPPSKPTDWCQISGVSISPE